MATVRYYAWNGAGRPYRLAPWVVTAKRQAAAHGVRWLGDLGNDVHLMASTPEDHTPFSVTAWPVALPDYVVLAEDFAAGPYCAEVLKLCRAGDPRVGWIKYMNMFKHHYNRKSGFVEERSSDAHWHISGMSNHSWADIPAGFDLFAPAAPAPPGGGRRMGFVVHRHFPSTTHAGCWWAWSDGLRYKPIVTWPQKETYERMSGVPELVVTDDAGFDVMAGRLDSEVDPIEIETAVAVMPPADGGKEA